MCSHYNYTPDYVIDMPIRLFWLLSDTIQRLNAENDLRSVRVAVCGQSPELYGDVDKELRQTMGDIYVFDEEAMYNPNKDDKGIAELKAMMAGF